MRTLATTLAAVLACATLISAPIAAASDTTATPVGGGPAPALKTTLVSPSESQGSISGVVRDAASGLPISDLTVCGYNQMVREGFCAQPSSATGEFRMHNLPDGTYLMQFSSDLYVSQFQNGVVVADGNSVSNINFELELGGLVSGRLFNISGEPVAGVNVCVKQPGYLYHWWPCVISDAEGQWRSPRPLPPGDNYFISTSSTDEYQESSVGPITVTPSQTSTGHNLTLTQRIAEI